MKRTVSIYCLVCLGVLLCRLSIAADREKPPEEPCDKVINMAIHPAGVRHPALEIQLLPPFLDQRPGNAAPLYMKSFLLLAQSKSIDDEEAMRYAELAARRSRCDWEMPIRDVENIYGVLLPELSSARNMGRLIALRARLNIDEGNYDEALHDLQTGYAMARHISEQPTLVSGMVGVAIADMMTDQLEVAVQSPGVPNLYWTITAMPDPLIDLRKALQLEAVGIYLLFPELEEMRRHELPPRHWKMLLAEFLEKIKPFTESVESKEPHEKIDIDDFLRRAYPIAREGLVERSHPRSDIDDMAPAQVVIMYMLETYAELRDEVFKWFHVPYWQAHEAIQKALNHVQATERQRKVMPLASLMLPAVGACHLRIAELQRRLDALRCIEAIRLYADTHDGKLPENLDDITEVPIPVNPVTGKLFGYHMEGETAVLEADGGRRRHVYRLKPAG